MKIALMIGGVGIGSLLLTACNRDPASQLPGVYKTHVEAGAGGPSAGVMAGTPIMDFEFTKEKMVKVVDMRGSEGSWRLDGNKLTFNTGQLQYEAIFRPERDEIEIRSVGGQTDFGNIRYYLRRK